MASLRNVAPLAAIHHAGEAKGLQQGKNGVRIVMHAPVLREGVRLGVHGTERLRGVHACLAGAQTHTCLRASAACPKWPRVPFAEVATVIRQIVGPMPQARTQACVRVRVPQSTLRQQASRQSSSTTQAASNSTPRPTACIARELEGRLAGVHALGTFAAHHQRCPRPASKPSDLVDLVVQPQDESMSEPGECGMFCDTELSIRMWVAGWQVSVC